MSQLPLCFEELVLECWPFGPMPVHLPHPTWLDLFVAPLQFFAHSSLDSLILVYLDWQLNLVWPLWPVRPAVEVFAVVG